METKQASNFKKSPWSWVPSLYFTEGLPYIIVMAVSTTMFKNLGISNADIGIYTSLLYLPWVIKPLWSPVVDLLKTKRWWIFSMQFIMGVCFSCIAFILPTDFYFSLTLAFLYLIAFSSATHDIAADGFYMLSLRDDQQAFFVGIRSAFYRLSMITGQGLMVFLAGVLAKKYNDNFQTAWAITFGILAVSMLILAIYHKFILPHPNTDVKNEASKKSFSEAFGEIVHMLSTFFKKKQIYVVISFILFYRLGEAQLVKMASPFLLDQRGLGGLGLDNEQIGFIYGTVGIIFLVIGGLIGGWVISKNGLKFWIWPMIFSINLPNAVYIFLAYYQPEDLTTITMGIAFEQFFYGFGFTALMMYMIYVAQGEYKTAHYAFCTGFMALGMMLPGIFSGLIQEALGYTSFFIWVVLSAFPGLLITPFLDIPSIFGKKLKGK